NLFSLFSVARIQRISVVFALLGLHQQVLRFVCSNGSILLVCNYILNLFPALLAFRNAESSHHRLWAGETNYEVDGVWIVSQANVGVGWGGFGRTRMRMIDGQ